MPLSPVRYAELLGKKLHDHKSHVYLLNTGWTGGPYGTGKRLDLATTRLLLHAVLSGELENADFKQDPTFGLSIPLHVAGIPSEILNPRNTWSDPAAYDIAVVDLANQFKENFKRFNTVPKSIIDAGPNVSWQKGRV